MSPDHLGRFRIAEEIGRGGMGIVYRAHDTRLGRDVALKVLPPDVVADPLRRARFEQEARAASGLRHPNIVTIHDITREEGRDVIVMELVDGRTLDLLLRRRLGLSQALAYAIQIVDALSRAHADGIVHRDLKPSNVMITPDGVVKILDFGLAKLVQAEEADEVRTVTAGEVPLALTNVGAVVGTAAYMSPEQAQGIAADARSDVFSFGCVLYEMVTGRRAFDRPTSSETLRAIVSDQPELPSRVVPNLPQPLDRVVTRCLDKDPRRRWQSMSDLRHVLQDLKEDSESGSVAVGAPPRRHRQWWAAVIAALAAVAVLGIVAWIWNGRIARPAPPLTTARLTYDASVAIFPTVSRDGRMFAYASNRADRANLDIWVQQVAGGQPLRITSDPAPDSQPSLSPDGARIVFRSERDGGGLYVVNTLGGDARRIADRGFFPQFSPDGSAVAFVDVPAAITPARIAVVPADGGDARPIHPRFAVFNPGVGSYSVWSPDGQRLLVLATEDGESASLDWWALPVAAGQPKRLDVFAHLPINRILGLPRAWTDRYLYFLTGTTVEGVNIFRVPFRAGDLAFAGPAEQLTMGAGMKWSLSVSADGQLLFSHMLWTMNAWEAKGRLDEGTIIGDLQPITSDETVKISTSVSRDGSTLAYAAFGGFQAGAEVRMRDLASGRETRLPAVKAMVDRRPVLSPDGRAVAHRQMVDGRPAYVVHVPGAAADRTVCSSCSVFGFFADAQSVLIGTEARELVRQELATGRQTLLGTFGPNELLDARLSWDERWIVVLRALDGGRAGIAVAPLSRAPLAVKDLVPVLDDSRVLASPRWSPSGTWLYFISARDGNNCVWRQRLDGGRPAGEPAPVLHVHGQPGMSFPLSLPPLEVTPDRLVLVLSEARANIYQARLDSW